MGRMDGSPPCGILLQTAQTLIDTGEYRRGTAMLVHVSQESPAQTQARLAMVLAQARWWVAPQLYRFEEFPDTEFAHRINHQALALVRDGHVWSQLVPCGDDQQDDAFTIFSFHFPEGLDTSGFVGWLASLIKQQVGTGVLVICGQNRAAGGIYDYWACPPQCRDAVLDLITRLRLAHVAGEA